MHFPVSTSATAHHAVRGPALLLMLVLGGLLPAQVFGRVITCRKDPIVLLSNNKVVQMTATISTHGRNVHRITYVLYAPEDTRVERIIYTGGKTASEIEEVIFVPNQPDGVYETETLVTAASPRVDVEARTLIGQADGTVTGVSDEPLAVRLHVSTPRADGSRKP